MKDDNFDLIDCLFGDELFLQEFREGNYISEPFEDDEDVAFDENGSPMLPFDTTVQGCECTDNFICDTCDLPF